MTSVKPSVDRLDTAAAIASIVSPSSVVVIGANEQLGKLTSGSVSNLLRHGFPGRIHVVNPNRAEVFGVATIPSLSELPEVPDTAVVVVGAHRVPQALEELAAVGVRTATVVASGFGEGQGDAEVSAQAALERALASSGVRILGPNTAGLLNIAAKYVPRASQNHPESLPAGRIGVVTQSGGLCNTLVNRAAMHGVGIGLAVSTGNQMDIDVWDVADYMLDDGGLDTVVTLIEGFSDPAKFVRFANRAREVGKPVVALKLGTSEAGQRAVETHSGSMAGSASVQQAVMADLNVIEVEELDQLWEVASLITQWGGTLSRCRSLTIITPSGGDGVMATDEASRQGLNVLPLQAGTISAMQGLAPEVQPENPFDTQAALVVSRPESLVEQISVVAGDHGGDAVLLALPVLATDFALTALPAHLDGIAAGASVPVAASLWTADGSTQAAVDSIRALGWPVFTSSVRAVRAISRYATFVERAGRVPGRWERGPSTQEAQGELLSYWHAREELSMAGVAFNTATLVLSVDEALDAARLLGGPVTLKLSTTRFNHKADAGAVLPFVSGDQAVRDAATRLLGMLPSPAPGEGLVVEEFVPSVLPLFLGAIRDPEFGPVLLVGLGGGFAEPYADVARLSCPADQEQIRSALASTRVATLLRKHPVAHDALVLAAERLSQRMAKDASWHSFDLNPLLVRIDSTLTAVDARLQRAATRQENT